MNRSTARALERTVQKACSSVSAPINSGGACQSFNFLFNYPHTCHHQTEDFLSRPSHPLRLILKDRLAKADRSALWTFVYASSKISKKVMIRKHYIKRLKRAVKVALDEQGMDEDGRPARSGGQGSAESLLLGTLHLFPNAKVKDMTFESLVADSRTMIRRAMAEQKKYRISKKKIDG